MEGRVYQVPIDHPRATIDRVVIVSPLTEWVEAYKVARRRAFSRYGVSTVLDNHEEQAARASRVALVLGMAGDQVRSGISVHRSALISGIDLPSAVMLAGIDMQWAALTHGTIELSGTMRSRTATREDVDIMLEVSVGAIALFGADAVGTAPPHMKPRYAELGFAPCQHLPAFEYPEGMITTPMSMLDPVRMPLAEPTVRERMLTWRNALTVWVPTTGDLA